MLYFYQIYNNCVDLYYPNEIVRVFFTNQTGQVIKRPKTGPVTQYFIDHKGIILGQLANGTIVVLHNHIEAGTAVVTTINDFLRGQRYTYDYKFCSNDTYTMLTIALNDVKVGQPYSKLNYNCQTYVNKACTNNSVSDDTGRVIGGIAATAAIALLLGAIFSE